MFMSRAEIAAAARARRFRRVSCVCWDSAPPREPASVLPVMRLAAACAARVRSAAFYRALLVADLRMGVADRTYFRAADRIVDQLLGRLVAGSLER